MRETCLELSHRDHGDRAEHRRPGAALGLTRLLGYILYKVSPRDPLAFGAAFVVMTIASLVACLVPAWRAPRIDPVRALRD